MTLCKKVTKGKVSETHSKLPAESTVPLELYSKYHLSFFLSHPQVYGLGSFLSISWQAAVFIEKTLKYTAQYMLSNKCQKYRVGNKLENALEHLAS